MKVKQILGFLRDVAANNNREWFAAHKDKYLECKADFEEGVAQLIGRIAEFDPNIAHLEPKDCCYRFYRDVRFSEDKSPYKRHFGAYICERGKKSLRAGYYIHIQPGRCFISCGSYWLPTNILTACRNEIMGNIDEWLRCVDNERFVSLYGYPNAGLMTDEDETFSEKGFGLAALKTCPKDFPRDYEHIEYLRMKDYACWHRVADDFCDSDCWLEETARMFEIAKPMNDFINSVVSDYD